MTATVGEDRDASRLEVPTPGFGTLAVSARHDGRYAECSTDETSVTFSETRRFVE